MTPSSSLDSRPHPLQCSTGLTLDDPASCWYRTSVSLRNLHFHGDMLCLTGMKLLQTPTVWPSLLESVCLDGECLLASPSLCSSHLSSLPTKGADSYNKERYKSLWKTLKSKYKTRQHNLKEQIG